VVQTGSLNKAVCASSLKGYTRSYCSVRCSSFISLQYHYFSA